MSSKDFLSTSEIAALLGISRVAALQRVQRGEIPAIRIGRAYKISRANLPEILREVVSPRRRQELERVADRALREYRKTFESLGRE